MSIAGGADCWARLSMAPTAKSNAIKADAMGSDVDLFMGILWMTTLQRESSENLYSRCVSTEPDRAQPTGNENPIRGTLKPGRRTGRSLPEVLAQAGVAGRGKSELRRAVCRITSGTRASKPVDG